ncbi:MAG: aspartate kinase [Methermicoccaceae archaeon]
MRLVMKFGGVSVADGECISHVASLVKSYRKQGYELVVVTSAMKGVTDALLTAASEALEDGNTEAITERIAQLRTSHERATTACITDEPTREKVLEEVSEKLDELERALVGICYLGELTPRSLDYISSFGERLAAPVFAGALQCIGVPSCSFDGKDVGILTDSNHQNAKPLDTTYARLEDTLVPLLSESVPVVGGFMGADEKGIITTLGRGGSDLTASLIGAAIGADEIWLWKETDGIMTTDPQLVPEARALKQISYAEAMEMSFFGAKVLHPRAIEPAIRHSIPVRVKNTFHPEREGTLVVAEHVQSKTVVKAVSVIHRVAMITISGSGMIGTIGVAARVFSSLAEAGVNIRMISQGSSEANISMVVDGAHAKKAVKVLRDHFRKNTVRDILLNERVCVVAVVGAGMIGTPGVAGRVFSTMGSERINVIMVSQGSSQSNISFVIEEKDAQRAVAALHREFALHEIE